MFKYNVLGITLVSGLLFLSACNQTPKTAPASAQGKSGLEKTPFGNMPDGRPVDLYTLKNAQGMEVKITNYGGIIVSISTPDKNGKFEDVVLGYDSLSGYLHDKNYFGATIGRYANRIGKGKFNLDGKQYTLATNNNGNHLHGGLKGFDKVLWTGTAIDGPEPAVKLTYTSPDGEEGYPGTLNVDVTFTLQKDNTLRVLYNATTDKTTIVNLTNHSYFNLTGGAKRDILDHELSLNAPAFLPVDKTLIPTGLLETAGGSVFDFAKPTRIGAHVDETLEDQIVYGKGYDHCWALAGANNALKKAATLYEPESGRVLEISTYEPGVQFYSGNFLDGSTIGKGGVAYKFRYGLCLETQHYPDSPSQPYFPSVVLKPGDAFQSMSMYKFSVRK
jgi:aldose 1-epimerase